VRSHAVTTIDWWCLTTSLLHCIIASLQNLPLIAASFHLRCFDTNGWVVTYALLLSFGDNRFSILDYLLDILWVRTVLHVYNVYIKFSLGNFVVTLKNIKFTVVLVGHFYSGL